MYFDSNSTAGPTALRVMIIVVSIYSRRNAVVHAFRDCTVLFCYYYRIIFILEHPTACVRVIIHSSIPFLYSLRARVHIKLL